MHCLSSATPFLAVFALAASFSAFSLAAQDVAAAADQDQLVLKTADGRLVDRLLRSSGAEAPELEQGEHYVVKLGTDGEWVATTGAGAVPFMVVEARPKLLMATFAEQIDQGRRMAKSAAAMGAAGSPIRPAQMASMMDTVFDFPQQIELLTVNIEGDADTGFNAHAELRPVAKSWLQTMTQTLRPTGKGAHDVGSGMVEMALDLAPEALQATVDSMGDFWGLMVPEEDRAGMTKLLQIQFGASDGTMAFAMQESQIRTVLGCSDPAAMLKIMASEDWTKFQRSFFASQPNAEIEMKREKHGDLDVVRTLADMGQANPLMPDGKIDGYSAVVGNAVISVVNGGRKAFDELVASATEGLKRVPLPEGSVLSLRVRMAEMMAMSGEPVGSAPDTVALRVGKKDKDTLVLDVRIAR